MDAREVHAGTMRSIEQIFCASNKETGLSIYAQHSFNTIWLRQYGLAVTGNTSKRAGRRWADRHGMTKAV